MNMVDKVVNDKYYGKVNTEKWIDADCIIFIQSLFFLFFAFTYSK